MDDKFLCVMAEIDRESQNKLNSMYQNILDLDIIGKQTKNIPYHITLGTININEENRIIQILDNLSKKVNKFNISFEHIGLFGLKVLFITPLVNQEFLLLQQSLNKEYPNLFNITPHVTILIDDEANILKALPIISDSFIPFIGSISKISLYEFFPTRLIKEYSLK